MTNLDLTPIKNRLAAVRGTAYEKGRVPEKEWSALYEHAPTDIVALIAEVERLRRSGATLGLVIEKQCQAALDATGLHDLIDETGDGDWGAVWETVAEMGETCRRLRAQLDAVRALHVPVDANYYAATVKECCVCPGPWPCPTIRALDGEAE